MNWFDCLWIPLFIILSDLFCSEFQRWATFHKTFSIRTIFKFFIFLFFDCAPQTYEHSTRKSWDKNVANFHIFLLCLSRALTVPLYCKPVQCEQSMNGNFYFWKYLKFCECFMKRFPEHSICTLVWTLVGNGSNERERDFSMNWVPDSNSKWFYFNLSYYYLSIDLTSFRMFLTQLFSLKFWFIFFLF